MIEDNDSDSDNGSEIGIMKKQFKYSISSDNESDDETNIDESIASPDNEWKTITSRDIIPQKIQYTSVSSRNSDPQISPNYIESIDYFKSFFTNELIKKIVNETNRYANNEIKEEH